MTPKSIYIQITDPDVIKSICAIADRKPKNPKETKPSKRVVITTLLREAIASRIANGEKELFASSSPVPRPLIGRPPKTKKENKDGISF